MTNVITDYRLSALHHWLSTVFPEKVYAIAPVAGDASFRRYFRVRIDNMNEQTFIVMDAPPEKESCDAFIKITTVFENSPARFPTILASDVAQGFLLLTDFGDQQLLPLLHTDSAEILYQSAMNTLLTIQRCDMALPYFDDALYWREFDILNTWYIKKNLNKKLYQQEEKELKQCYQLLINVAYAQPQVFVHRDYHSRNIILCGDGELGILDFQDAVRGPITYDLVSLLKDCYIAWPTDQIEKWVYYFYEKLNLSVDFKTFLRWFDFTGLQRHLKCLGIFSRLHYRDGKENYLKEIPRVLNYVHIVCEKYAELQPLFRYV